MKRKVTTDQHKPGWRELLWASMCELKKFTKDEVREHAGVSVRATSDYLQGLERAGFVKCEPSTTVNVYTVVRKVGTAPVIKRDGTEVAEHRVREQLWRTMKILGEFSTVELKVTASTAEHPMRESFVKHYITALTSAGYLAQVSRGTNGRVSRYRLLSSRARGAQPPEVQYVMQVFDPNSNKIVWQAGAAS